MLVSKFRQLANMFIFADEEKIIFGT